MATRSVATSDTLETFRTTFNSLGTDVGDLNSLTTTDKTSVVAAVNEAKSSTFSFTLRDSSSTTQTIFGTDTLNVIGSGGISAVVSATDTLTISLDSTITGLTSITSTTITDGTLSINSGSISSATSITSTTITDGTLSINSGSISSAVNGNFSGAVTATSFSGDGASLTALNVSTDSTPQLGGNLDTQSFTVDGRDVSTDGTKLDTIATNATANPNAIDNVVEDTTPQLGGNLDTQSFTVDGRDVSTDGTKLDTIATSATANPNAIDNIVEDTSPQLGGGLDLNSNNITGTGNINITGDLDVTNDIQTDSLGVGTAPSGTSGEIRATNDVTAFYSSDIALKENIVNIPDPIEALKKLNGVLFDWKKSYIDEKGGEDGYFIRKKDVGVIAQDVEKVLPEAVATRPDGIKAVKYDRLTCLLIEAVKTLNNKVEILIKEKK